MRNARRAALALACLVLPLVSACSGKEPDLVVYVAMDQEHSERVVRLFEERTGLVVEPVFDVEANKTVGLVNQIRQEARAPRCDVFWNNEIANTVALAREGLLEAYESPSAADVPAAYKDPERFWTGFALRARCLILNTEAMAALEPDAAKWPSSIHDLESATWARHGSVARPLTGTTLTHFAVLYHLWGWDEGHRFASALVELNAEGGLDLASGNGPLMRSVGEGVTPWGFTDTDDFNVGRLRGFPVERRFADQGEGGMGTLVIPNTVAIVKGGPNPENARRFVDFLLSKEVEQILAEADSAQIPTRDDVPRPAHVPSLSEIRVMEVDWNAVGELLPRVQEDLKTVFLR